jgi:hypothetical protein
MGKSPYQILSARHRSDLSKTPESAKGVPLRVPPATTGIPLKGPGATAPVSDAGIGGLSTNQILLGVAVVVVIFYLMN